MHWDMFNEYAVYLKSDRAFGVLLPLTNVTAVLKARKAADSLCEEATEALGDDLNQDVSFTVFDWIGRSSSTATKMLVQTGKEEVWRISRAGVPLTPKPKKT